MTSLFFKTKDGELVNIGQAVYMQPTSDGVCMRLNNGHLITIQKHTMADIENFLLKIQGAL
jgi:hypothetical protein